MKTARAVLALALASIAFMVFAADSPLQSYVFKYRGDTRVRIINDDVNTERFPAGDYLWFRWDGRPYRITDARTLAQLDEAYRPVREAKAESREIKTRRRELKTRERELRNEQRSLEREIRTASRRGDEVSRYESDVRTIERKRETLERDMERLEADLDRRSDRVDSLRTEAERKWMRLLEDAMRSGAAKKD
ncbi:MAG TPA: hypothetical protein VGF69_00290 [Thermoanaerobaculia bacterium]|jgi:hypothetical protein